MLFVFNLNAVLSDADGSADSLRDPADLPVARAHPAALRHASADLGASAAQTFLRITLPLSLPGVASAASFVFVLAIGDFLTPQMVGGNPASPSDASSTASSEPPLTGRSAQRCR